MADGDKIGVIVIIIILVLALVIYSLVLFESWKGQKGVFSPYVPPPAPPNTFYPLGNVSPATQSELDAREDIKTQLNNAVVGG